MEDQTQAAMNAAVNQASLLEGGPLFDTSDIDTAPGRMVQRQRTRNYTPILFNLDEANHNKEPANENFSCVGGSGAIQTAILHGDGSMERMPCHGQGALANYSQNFGQAIITEVTSSPAIHLRRLPESFATRSRTEEIHESGQQQEHGSYCRNTGAAMRGSDMVELREITARLCNFADTMMQMEAIRQQRDEETRKHMETAAKIMTDYVASQTQRALAKEERIAKDRKLDLELKLATGAAAVNNPYFNWLFGYGVAPRTGKRKTVVGQTKFDKIKNHARSNAMWFVIDGSVHELSQPFIQFNDTPRVSIDGMYIKKYLMGEEDMGVGMAFALVRTLRSDENFRYPGAQGECHYVLHTWAEEVMTPGSTVESCEVFFTQPMLQYALGGCNRVVAFVALDDGLASVSMDFKDATTLLIHPSVASATPVEVLATHYVMMNTLTLATQAHMGRICQVYPPEKQWKYDVALKGGPMHFHSDMGTATAFYSIPRDNQFMHVSHETILLAKQTFIYGLHRMCYPTTKQPIRKSLRKKLIRRDAAERFKVDDCYFRGSQSQADSHGSAA